VELGLHWTNTNRNKIRPTAFLVSADLPVPNLIEIRPVISEMKHVDRWTDSEKETTIPYAFACELCTEKAWEQPECFLSLRF
jgi:hypothetical protein